MGMNRRRFLHTSALAAAGCALHACAHEPNETGPTAKPQPESQPEAKPAVPPLFTISLAEWSLHRALKAGEMTNLDFPRRAREEFGIDAVEYVNSFFRDQVRDRDYLADLRSRCEGLGVQSVLIMCDGLGELGNPNAARRNEAVDNHKPWVHAAKFLGCHSIRVNAASGHSSNGTNPRH